MKLSVCIVTYNHEALITQCIDSVLRQKVDFNYEIVVGEDCSTDGTRGILQELSAKYPDKLKVNYRARNMGAELNFNQTISECTGEYVAFLEGDNNWTSDDKLQLQVDFLDQHPQASFCCHRVGYVDETGARLPTVLPPQDPSDLTDINFLFQDSNPIGLGTIVARRALLQGLDDWVRGLKMGDWPLCMMLATRGKIGFVAKEMSLQRVHSGGTWQKLPPAVQIAYMIQMCNHVGPKLPSTVQPTITAMTQRFMAMLCDQFISGDVTQLPLVLEKIAALNDRGLTDQIMRAVVLGERERSPEKITAWYRAEVDKRELERILAQARKKPGMLWRDLMAFRVSTYLAAKQGLFSEKQRYRFDRSAAKRDPNRGLARFGKAENQNHKVDPIKADDTVGRRRHDPARPTILLVTHDTGRTGAPILALNIAQNLAKRYNVVTLALRNGDLMPEFTATSVRVVVGRKFTFAASGYEKLIRNLSRKHKFRYAIVNSMESRGVLQGLHDCGIPVVSLIHEFSSYINPRTAAQDFFRLSDQTVFSTKITLDNALVENDLLTAPGLHVLPQGKCVIPKRSDDDIGNLDEVAWLKGMLRPETGSDRKFVVIGAGSVNIRKGVDLFIEVATRVLKGPGGSQFRFVWIGGGYDPDRDVNYSIYLRDQMRRAGITEGMVMLNETSEIETAYDLADALVLTSRLDPLPNVAIDALSIGRPVLCFDRTTGIADILSDNGLGVDCVADYLDTSDMARKIRALAQAPDHYAAVAGQCLRLAARIFDFDTYVAGLEAIAAQATQTAAPQPTPERP